MATKNVGKHGKGSGGNKPSRKSPDILKGMKEAVDICVKNDVEAEAVRKKVFTHSKEESFSGRGGEDINNGQLGETVEGAKGLAHDPVQSSQIGTVNKTPSEGSASTDGNGDATQSASDTKQHGCPVSMINGEELLTITDVVLPGPLPFTFSRLYRTTALNNDIGMGPGWSHSLNHSLLIEPDALIWKNNENANTRYPLPTQEQPAYYNRLAKSAAYLGKSSNEYVLVKGGLSYIFEQISETYGRLVEISDQHQNRWVLEYDASQRPVRLKSDHGVGLELIYDGNLLVALARIQKQNASAWPRLKNIATFCYQRTVNGVAQLIANETAAGGERYTYDDSGLITLRELPSGLSFYWEWQGEGSKVRCIRHWSNAGFEARYEWDEQKHRVEVTNSDGSSEIYQHDDSAQLIEQVDPDGAVTQYEYDDDGHLIKETSPLGGVTEHHYNDQGEKQATVAADGTVTRFSYWRGNLTNVYTDLLKQDRIKHNAIEWRYRYNKQGLMVSEQSPLREKTLFEYTDNGKLSRIEYPDGRKEQLAYNAAGLLTRHIKADGQEQRYGYNEDGLVTAEWHSVPGHKGAQWRYDRDPAGRITCITDPKGQQRHYSYNSWGKVTEERDEKGNTTRYEYHPHLPLVLRETRSDGSQLNFEYDVRQRFVTCITNENGEKHHISYYTNGHIQSETTFDGRELRYQYDLTGKLIEKVEVGTAGTERITKYVRDLMGRLIEKELPDGEKISYQYDLQGQLIGVEDGVTPLAWEYDLAGRLIAEHQGLGSQFYQYDQGGNLTSHKLPDQNQLTYDYNPQGKLQQLSLNNQAITHHRYQQGVEVGRQQGRRVSHYRYDEAGRLALHHHHVADEERHLLDQEEHNLPALQRQYHYDVSGELSQKQDSLRGTQDYHYDTSGQLIASQKQGKGNSDKLNEQFSYDRAGNLQPSTQTQLRHNRLLSTASAQYDYDEFGNLSKKTEKRLKEQLVTTYEYDCQNRLIQATTPDGTVANYTYDAFGRRTSKTVTKPDTAPVTTEFYWQGDRLAYETDSQHKHQCYLYEPGSFKPLALVALKHTGSIHTYEQEQAESPNVYYYQNDQLGTPQELTDKNGNIVWAATMLSWGKIQRQLFSKIDNPLRFQGQYHDEETGLHYNRNRYYDPYTARFITLDPIGLAGGLNNYQYVTNPTGWVDPLGLSQNEAKGPCCGGDGTDKVPTVDTGESEVPDVTKEELDWKSVVPKKGKYKGQSREDHVRLHNSDNPGKPSHGVFYGDGVDATNRAWTRAQQIDLKPDSSGNLFVPMDKLTGRAGGQAADTGELFYGVHIKLVPNSNKIITSYPGN
ncbi:RHS repeat-associated core domain-containing protein [Neptuniibacter sp. PT8_73]|uniref:RHS repeat-associated core domain-containing protein n=1 Tax=Neptuniibacter sp. PT8_73 TaxID=3398206 RepID=UPI0039F57210